MIFLGGAGGVSELFEDTPAICVDHFKIWIVASAFVQLIQSFRVLAGLGKLHANLREHVSGGLNGRGLIQFFYRRIDVSSAVVGQRPVYQQIVRRLLQMRSALKLGDGIRAPASLV